MKGIIVSNIPKARDYNAMGACLRTAGYMKDRRAPRGGSRNNHREYLEEALEEFVCDFCGKPSGNVRRVALDSGYDRLLSAEAPLWGCQDCSVKKEETRLGSRSQKASNGLLGST
jgi:hypothetical protein